MYTASCTNSKLTRSLSVALALSMILLLAGFPPPSEAFRPLTLVTFSPKSASIATTWVQTSSSTVTLWVSNQDFDQQDDELSLIVSNNADEKARLWKQVKDVNNKFWDYTCNFFYIGMSCLILLNVCGFGYTFSREEGLNVMPMQTYRQERQWREEIERQERQPQNMVAPAAASAIQKAPAAFLWQQQQK